MCLQKRFVPVFLGFLGLLIIGGYEVIISIVLVHILKSDDSPEYENKKFLGLYCSVNTSSQNLSATWTVTSSQYLHCSYFASLFSTQVLGGYLAARYSSKMVCGIAILMSSVLLLAIPTAIEVHVVLVFAIRVIKGCFDGCILPSLVGVISAWAPKSEKSRMIALITAGTYFSPAIAFAVSGITACVVSRNASVYIYGGCGVLWSGIWLISVYDTPAQHSGIGRYEKLLFEREGPLVQSGSEKVAGRIPWRKICLSLPMWSVLICSFCRNWMYSCMLFGIPQYFKVAFTTNIAEIGLETALPSVFATIMTIAGGIMIDILLKSQLVSTTAARKIAQCIGFGVEGCCIFSLRYIERQDIALIILCVGIGFSGLSVSGYQVNPLDLAPQYASILTGFYRMGTLGGVINTAVSGRLNPKSIEVWQSIFTLSGSVLVGGAVFYGIFGSGKRQNWVDEPKEQTTN